MSGQRVLLDILEGSISDSEEVETRENGYVTDRIPF